MGLPVTTVASGGLPVVDVTGSAPKLGLPVTETTRGLPVTKVAAGKPGLAATYVAAAIGTVEALSYAYKGTDSQVSAATTYTFAAKDIGTAAASRRVHVWAAGYGSTRTVASLTVGGVAALFNRRQQRGVVTCEIWTALVPAGSTADIVVTWSGSQDTGCVIYWWTSQGLPASGMLDGGGNNVDIIGSTTYPNTVIAVESGGFVVGGAIHGSVTAGNIGWSAGITEDNETIVSGNIHKSGASAYTTGTSLSVRTEVTTDPNNGAPYVVVSFGPSSALGVLDGLAAPPVLAHSVSRKLLSSYSGTKYDLTAGAVSSFNDQTGNSRHFTDGATSTRRPAVSTAGPNSLACLDFDGSTDYLETTGKTMDTFWSVSESVLIISGIFDVLTNSLTSPAFYNGHAMVSAVDPIIGIHGGDNAGTKQIGSLNYDGSFKSAAQTAVAGTAYVIMLRHSGGNVYISLNGGAETSVPSGNTTLMTKMMRLGFSDAQTNFFDGKIFEVVGWATTVPNSTVLAAIIADFKAKCGA